MKTKQKALLLSLSALLLVAVSVMGTIAYLTATSDEVKNTFTVGSVDLTLDESVVNEYGVPDEPASRLPKGNNYKLIPGREYTKDPVVHVTSGSEKSYVFIKLVNGLAAIEAEPTDEVDTSISFQLSANKWTFVAGSDGIYQYSGSVDARENQVDLKVFESFKVDSDASAEILATYNTAEIIITAYAIQADGLTVEEAYAEKFPKP